jgi:hypothetical protein
LKPGRLICACPDETFKLHQAVGLPGNRLKAALPAFLPERVKFILFALHGEVFVNDGREHYVDPY